MNKGKIIYKTKQQLQLIEDSWKYLTELLYKIKEFIKPWIISQEIEEFAGQYIKKHNLKWAFKWFMAYPANLCISVNNCVVHGEPSWYVLKEGDLLKIDAWINYKWMITDAAFSMIVWTSSNKQAKQLIKATKKALDRGVGVIEIWKTFYDYSFTVYNTIKQSWFSIIENLTWHGVWVKVHEPPRIYNFPSNEMKKIKIRPGMCFALEPITAIKSQKAISVQENKWDLLTEKWDLWAHWEYTVIVDDNWPRVVAGVR